MKPPSLPKNRSWKIKLLFVLLLITATGFTFFVLPLIIRATIFQPYHIPTRSMKPTLLPGDYILVDKTHSGEEMRRGDIIVFISPKDKKVFAKRVVGLPNENVELKDHRLYINNDLIEESYILTIEASTEKKTHTFGPVTVPERSFFVLGDNRGYSFDSRHFGSVTFDKVIGRVTRIYWSWDKENNRVRWERINKKVKQ